MPSKREGRSALFPLFSLAAIAAGSLLGVTVSNDAQSQISSRSSGAPKFSSSAPSSPAPHMAKAPVQVELPAPAPMRIFPGLEEPLIATGPVGNDENRDLDAALAAFHDAPAKAGAGGDYDDYAQPLLGFVSAHPKSNWNPVLFTDLGLGYYHAGYYSKAFGYWQQAWATGRDATNPQAHLIIDRAVGELARMHARVGHAKELDDLFADIGKRPIGGPATELLQGAREGRGNFRNRPEISYLCGPQALKNVLVTLKAKPKQIAVANDAKSGIHGVSLPELASLASKAGLRYTLIHREAGQPVPVPSVMNLNIHHYAAVTEAHDGKYTVLDPTFAVNGGLVVSPKALDAEASGYFLVPDSVMKASGKTGWRTVSRNSDEAKAVYGMGKTTNSQPCPTCQDTKAGGSPSNSNGGGSPTSGVPSTPVAGGTPPLGGIAVGPRNPPMTIVDAHMMIDSLNLTDTPVGYKPQKGPAAFTSLTYNQREEQQPAVFSFSNVSPKWNFTWQAYIQDDPTSPGNSVTRYNSGGGAYVYPTYISGSGQLFPEATDTSVSTRIPATGAVTSYTHVYSSGAKEVYSKLDGAATFPRRIFLTSVTDPAGNTLTINYDATFRVTSIVDAMGRSTTFTYGLTSYPLLVTKVTDPFGRFTSFTYDTSQRLKTITDPVGITSTFTYSATETTFITSLVTPYGTSTFNDTPNPNDTPGSNARSLTMTDPLGYTDYIYYYDNDSITPASDPAATLPAGMATDNGLLNYRNTYRWNPHQFALGCTMTGGVVQSEDFTKDTITHWNHYANNVNWTGRVYGSIKYPLENRIWYINSGGNSTNSGTLSQPVNIGRVLDDGTTQMQSRIYNGLGYITSATPPQSGGNRQFYTYAANNQDLVQVGQNNVGYVANFGTYNSAHLPSWYSGPDNQKWYFGWTTDGRISTITDPNTKVTTWNYDVSGRLSTIQNANLVTQVTYTYDSADRVRTKTDSEGYVLTYDYDNIDRVTKITYPDATTDLYDYTFQSGTYVGTASLELRKHTDRLGRVTTYGYDADRRLTSVTEPTSGALTRTTNYQYYEDGTLKDIIDANGNDTHWDIDIESRPTKKTYQYGTASATFETYVYENTTSRLKSITDALGQTKTYSYNLGDQVTGITYTGSVNPTPNVSFTYNNTSNWFPATMVDGTGTTHFNYTAVGTNGALKLSSIVGPYTNSTIGFTYDALGRLAGRTITGGNETFGYDFINRLNSHVTPLGTFTLGYLGQTDQMTSQSVTNGAVTVSTGWGYDTNTNDRRLISITNSGVTRSYTLGYGTSPVNVYDIMSITDTAATGHPWATQSRNYTYDLIDRLLTANSTTPGNDTYAYDKLDNATTYNVPGTSTSPTYNGFNQIKTWGAKTYVYDNNGNLTSGDGAKTYKYDAENRLIEIDYVGTTNKSVFAYDGLDHRISDAETVSGTTTTTYYLWCGDVICQTRNSSQTAIRRDLREGEFNISTSQKLIYMRDQLGSSRDVIDAMTGTRVASYDYTPYGAVARSSVTNGTDYQYARQFIHPQSTLNLAALRAQDGNTGRWINRDPIREAGGINLYGYVWADPIDKIDLRGLEGSCPGTGSPLPPPYDCKALWSKMINQMSMMDTKYQAMLDDKYDYWDTLSWGTHQMSYSGYRVGLSRMKKEAEDNNCPLPPQIQKYIDRLPPIAPGSTFR